jgi:phage FluMu protein gp41
MNREQGASLDDFIYYLERHIELDGDEHGPLAMQMMINLCGHDLQKWNDCFKVSQKALKARLVLWDSILAEIKN